MSGKYRNDTDLARAIGDLPRAIPPARDLWPDIEQKLPDRSVATVNRKPGWYRQALAAAVVAAFAAGILLGRQMGAGAPGGEPPPELANRALMAATQASEREYLAAFRQFIPVGGSQAVLGQQAVDNIEASWLDLQQAETALMAALEEHPENIYLNQRLLDLRARQLEFLQQLATLDQFSRRKT
jgi:hypothetical protein